MLVCYNYIKENNTCQGELNMNLVIQLIGGLGVVASIISFQCKKHSSILFFRTLNEFIFAIQYFLLGAYTGMSMNLVGCIRNIIFTNQVKNNKKTIVTSTIFCIMFFVFGLVSWRGKKKHINNICKNSVNNCVWQ